MLHELGTWDNSVFSENGVKRLWCENCHAYQVTVYGHKQMWGHGSRQSYYSELLTVTNVVSRDQTRLVLTVTSVVSINCPVWSLQTRPDQIIMVLTGSSVVSKDQTRSWLLYWYSLGPVWYSFLPHFLLALQPQHMRTQKSTVSTPSNTAPHTAIRTICHISSATFSPSDNH